MLIYQNPEGVPGQRKFGNPWCITCQKPQISLASNMF